MVPLRYRWIVIKMEQTRISSVQASAIREVRERWDGAVDADDENGRAESELRH